MDAKEFFIKCEMHDFNYHRTTDMYWYDVEKEIEYELRKEIQKHPEFADIYTQFRTMNNEH